MTVKLEYSIKRFIGESTDVKPYIGTQQDGSTIAANDLPAGSSFLETDTFRIARFDGTRWTYDRDDDRMLEKLDQIVNLLMAIKEHNEILVDQL